jgi:predicted enzyme related to lactoylglutathione lyase
MNPVTILRTVCAVIALTLSSMPARAESPPPKILSVGAISIDPCQDAKVLADWYSHFGIATKEFKGGYYGQLDTAAGPFVFGIHPKKADSPAKSSASIAIVLRVENFETAIASLREKGLVPEKIEKDQQGQFAHFHDPDGNKVSIWGN